LRETLNSLDPSPITEHNPNTQPQHNKQTAGNITNKQHRRRSNRHELHQQPAKKRKNTKTSQKREEPEPEGETHKTGDGKEAHHQRCAGHPSNDGTVRKRRRITTNHHRHTQNHMKTDTKREPTPPRKLTNSALNQEPPPKTHKQPPSDNDDGEASDLEGGNLPAEKRTRGNGAAEGQTPLSHRKKHETTVTERHKQTQQKIETNLDLSHPARKLQLRPSSHPRLPSPTHRLEKQI